MGPIKVHSDEDDSREELAKHEERLVHLNKRVEVLEQRLDDLRKWQHSVLGASAFVMFLLATFGVNILKYLIGGGNDK